MWAKIRAKIEGWFDYSETILWARLQMFLSAAFAVAISFDWSPLATGTVPTKQQYVLCGILFAQGVATEYLRRRGTEIRNGVIRSTDTVDK